MDQHILFGKRALGDDFALVTRVKTLGTSHFFEAVFVRHSGRDLLGDRIPAGD